MRERPLVKLEERWLEAWPKALALWSRYTRLREPLWCHIEAQEGEEGLTGSFAMIRLNDHTIVISLRQVQELKLEEFALEILAHEIGHHVYAPGDLTDNAMALARTRRGLPGIEDRAPMVLNLYEDLLINDRLVRFHNLRLAEVYQTIYQDRDGTKAGKVLSLYMRAYELLWGLEPQFLRGCKLKGPAEGDAQLIARLVRVYGNDWINGAGGFAALLFPYLLDEKDTGLVRLLDADSAGAGAAPPAGLTENDLTPILHPAKDPRVVGAAPSELSETEAGSDKSTAASAQAGHSAGQHRQPFEYGHLLRALGLSLTDAEVAMTYYRERAIPHLIPFPSREAPQSDEPLMEGLEPWDTGSPLEEVDWLQSVLISPKIFPGLTTVQRSWGKMSGKQRNPEPLDLDLYVDCSGSMPNPQRSMSFITLAGAIVMMSALRAGSRVQATLWSGAGQFDTTRGFIRDEKMLFGVLTGYLGGSTAFPNHILRDTFTSRTQRDRPVHILILSDEGIDTMRQVDEKGNQGMKIAQMALERSGGGGTMLLNMHQDYLKRPFFVEAQTMGWGMYQVADWESMVAFAREFAKLKYAGEGSQNSPAKGRR